MTATTQDLLLDERSQVEGIEEEVAIATSATVYVGGLVNFNAAGRLVDATNTAGQTFAGVVIDPLNDSGSPLATLTGNAAGTVKARIRYNHQLKVGIKTASRTTTNLNKTAFVLDNQTAQGTGVGTTLKRIAMGPIAIFTDSTKAYAYVTLTRTLGASAATG